MNTPVYYVCVCDNNWAKTTTKPLMGQNTPSPGFLAGGMEAAVAEQVKLGIYRSA